jgi:hypothetical protein
MMYGEELHEFVGSSANANAAATTAHMTKKAYLPGAVVYWGMDVTTVFANTSPVSNGLLALYRYTKKIQPATIVNAAGTGYAVGDLITVVQAAPGGSGGIVRVKTITVATGAVLTVEIVNPGINYVAGAATTTKLNGAGDDALTLTIVDRILLDTMGQVTGMKVGKRYMRRVPNVLDADVSPTPAPPASYNAGEDLVIVQSTAANGTGNTGAYLPVMVIQNRGENFAAQGLWVEANVSDVV